MALKAFAEKKAASLKYIMTGLEQQEYPHLDEARLAFSQVLNRAEKNKFAEKLMYNKKYDNYICDRITQIPTAERSYEIHGHEYYSRCAREKHYSNSYYGPLLKPGDYQNNKRQFLDERMTTGLYAHIYSLSVAGVKEASNNPDSPFMRYFINEDSLVHEHIKVIKRVLAELKEKADGFFWLPLAESPSEEVKNALKEIIEGRYLIAGYGSGRGIGLKFQNGITVKKLNKTLSTLSRYLSQVELNILRRNFWLSQNHPLKPNVPPQLFLPRVKDAESIIKKMEDYARSKNYGREILLSDITDITGACLAVEDYLSIENMMNLIRAVIPREFILEEENLYYKNKKNTPYRDVKYIIRLSHPSMPAPSNHICYELQIKIIDSKIFHDIDHAGIYKSELSERKKDYLKRAFWGQLWIKEKQLLDEYIEVNREYQKWCRANSPD
jgi:ppGpp synthetase/RelA/SpoT-type nucleotidyltranferase